MTSHASLRARLLMLVLVAVLPVFVVSAWWAFADEKADLVHARAALQAAADMEAARQGRMVESARHLLMAMAGAGDVRAGDPATCQRYLESLRVAIRTYNNFGIIGTDGTLRCDARKGVPLPIDAASLPHFTRALKAQDFAVGDYFIGVITGKPVLGFGYPVRDAQGRLDAIAFAAVRLESMQQALHEVPLTVPGLVTVLDRHGRVLASTDPGLPMGTQLPSATLAAMKAPQVDEGTGEAGEDIHAFAAVTGADGVALSVLVRASREAILRPSREQLVRELVALALLALLGAALAWSYAGRVIVSPTRQMLATRDLILNTMQEGVLAIDTQRNFLLFNTAAARIFGAAADSPAREPDVAALQGLYHPQDGSADAGRPLRVDELPLFLALRGESGRDFDMLVRNAQVPEGRLIRGNYGPIVAPGGAIVGALAVFSDVTRQHERDEEARLGELALRETQRMLVEAQRVGRIGSWQSSAATRRFWFSDEIYELLGVARGDFDESFEGFNRAVHPDDLPGLRERTEAVGVNGRLDHEFRVVTPHGQVRWVHVRGEPAVAAPGERPTGLVGVIQDISERKHAEAMRASAEKAAQDNLQLLARLARLQVGLAESNWSGEDLMDRFAAFALDVTQAPGAEFELLDGEELVLRACAGRTARPPGMRRPRGQLSREAASQGRNLLCEDADNDPRVNGAFCREWGIRSLAGTTVRQEGRVLGTLVVVSGSTAAFSSAHASVLQLLGEFLGGLLQRRAAQDEAAAHQLTLERAADAAQRIVAHASLGEGLREAAAQLRRVIPAGLCVVSLIRTGAHGDDAGYGVEGEVIARAVAGASDAAGSGHASGVAGSGHASDAAGDGRAAADAALALALECSAPAERMLRAGRPLRLSGQALAGEGLAPGNGWLGVPLIGRDGTSIGLAQWWDKRGGEFTLRDEYAALGMAQLISVAVENARLFDAIHELNQDLELKVRQRSRELARQEAVFRAVAEQAPQVMWIINPKGAVTYLNRYWYDLVGGQPPRWQGHEWMDAVHPEDVAQMRQRWSVCVRDHSIFSGMRRVIALDGKEHMLAYRASPVYDEAGQVTCWVGLDADITEIKAIEQALRFSNQELEKFSYSVSHDLRSPLNTIDGFSRLLQKDLQAGGARSAHYLSRILASTSHMSQLIDGLLALAQVSRQQLRLAPTNLAALGGEIAERLARDEPSRKVEFSATTDMLCHADARLLRALLQNLLGNAWKFTAGVAHPQVELGSKSGPGRMTTFFVRDNGAGFDMAYAARLFGAFERLHSQDEFQGTGIGLATVKRIVERHGGEVWAESAPGQGACFFFTLRGIDPDDGWSLSRY